MKRVFIGLIVVGLGLVSIFVVLNLAYLGPHIDSKGKARMEIQCLEVATQEFKAQFGQYPKGTNREIIGQLIGNNADNKSFILRRQFQFNGRGEVVDPLGKPYIFDQKMDGIDVHSQ